MDVCRALSYLRFISPGVLCVCFVLFVCLFVCLFVLFVCLFVCLFCFVLFCFVLFCLFVCLFVLFCFVCLFCLFVLFYNHSVGGYYKSSLEFFFLVLLFLLFLRDPRSLSFTFPR